LELESYSALPVSLFIRHRFWVVDGGISAAGRATCGAGVGRRTIDMGADAAWRK